MNAQTDSQLLRAYVEQRAEPAFAELVRRHVDFVYSAAKRMVCDSHLAEDVTQGVFVALAKQAVQLADRPVLSGWLHCTARNIAAQTVRTDVRRRAREQEAVAMNDLIVGEPEARWEQIAPHLDAALGELDEADRDALLLRYFERKSAQEMAQTLGITDEAAQKRVSRAVERLREIFSKRNSTIGASGQVFIISANAVQAAPIGLALTISTATVLTGTAASTSTVIAATKTITMTTFQKTLVAAALTAAVGTGIFEAHQVAQLREKNQTLQQQQAPLAEQIRQLQKECDNSTNGLASLLAENMQMKSGPNLTELLKLRGEVTWLRAAAHGSKQIADPFTQSVLALVSQASELNQRLQQMPDKKIPELQFLTPNDWLEAVKDADFQSDAGVRQSFSKLRKLAKNKFGGLINQALDKFVQANNGQLPEEIFQLQPYFDAPLDNSILQRYHMLHTGNVSDLPKDALVISENTPVDKDYDARFYFGLKGQTSSYEPDPDWSTHK